MDESAAWDRRVALGKNPWDRRVVLGKNPWDRRVVLGKNPWDRRVVLGTKNKTRGRVDRVSTSFNQTLTHRVDQLMAPPMNTMTNSATVSMTPSAIR
jgi:hypothetical protein